MKSGKIIGVLFLSLALAGCDAGGEFDLGKAISIGVGVLQATSLDEAKVSRTAALAARELDAKSRVAPAASPQVARLAKLTKGLQGYDQLDLNFKVYLSKEVNAFAMADGTVRVHSGLLDAMPDDQVLAVIAHEIAHVGLKHSYQQLRKALLTDVAFKAIGSLDERAGELTSSQLGQLGQLAVNARFSQSDELAADAWAVKFLKSQGHDPYAMQRAIETLRDKFGSGGGFLSSHPANDKRIANIRAAIAQS